MKTERQKQKQRDKRKKKAERWTIGNSEFENWMYENSLEDKVVQFSQYHWRIKTQKATVDVWAGSKKYWIHGTSGSRAYKTLQELKQYI